MPPLQVNLVFSMYLFHYVSLLCSQGSSSTILSDQIARRLGQLRSEVVLMFLWDARSILLKAIDHS
jgi:hypothetical protein